MNLIDDTLKERGEKYGDSWLTPSLALEAIIQGDPQRLMPLIKSGHFANWFIILGKLCRAMNSPELLDHWVDIAGYAELSVKALKDKEIADNPPFFPDDEEVEEKPFPF
jgi:hypothetical protein